MEHPTRPASRPSSDSKTATIIHLDTRRRRDTAADLFAEVRPQVPTPPQGNYQPTFPELMPFVADVPTMLAAIIDHILADARNRQRDGSNLDNGLRSLAALALGLDDHLKRLGHGSSPAKKGVES